MLPVTIVRAGGASSFRRPVWIGMRLAGRDRWGGEQGYLKASRGLDFWVMLGGVVGVLPRTTVVPNLLLAAAFDVPPPWWRHEIVPPRRRREEGS
jgi:hypothetical protein